MKNCINCGTAAADDAVSCAACGREFAYLGIPNSESGEPLSAIASIAHIRPTGATPLAIGWAGMGIGFLLVVSSFMVDIRPYGYTIDPDKVALQWNLMIGGSGLISLGLLLWSVGYIVKAMSFLQAKSDASN